MATNNPARLIESIWLPTESFKDVHGAICSSRYLAVIPKGNSPVIHVLDEGKLITLPFNAVTALAFRPVNRDWSAEMAGCNEEGIFRFDLELQVAFDQLPVHGAHSVTYSHDGRMLAVGSRDGMVRVWQLDRGLNELTALKVSDSCITGLAISATNDAVFVTTASGDALRLSLREDEEIKIRPALLTNSGDAFDWDCYTVATHPQARLTAFGGNGKQFWLLNHATNVLTALPNPVGKYVREVLFLPNMRQLAVIGTNGVAVWDVGTLNETLTSIIACPVADKVLTVYQHNGTLYVVRTRSQNK